jgi:hypothetical protein
VQASMDKIKKNGNIQMKSEIVDQININQQSNMALSANSTITQSYYHIKVNENTSEEGIQNNEKCK